MTGQQLVDLAIQHTTWYAMFDGVKYQCLSYLLDERGPEFVTHAEFYACVDWDIKHVPGEAFVKMIDDGLLINPRVGTDVVPRVIESSNSTEDVTTDRPVVSSKVARGGSKKEIGRRMYDEMIAEGKTEAQIRDRFMAELGMSLAGARTYVYNYRSNVWSA